MAFTRIIAAVLALVVPSILAGNPAIVFIGIFVFAVASIAIGLFWVPRLPKIAGSKGVGTGGKETEASVVPVPPEIETTVR